MWSYTIGAGRPIPAFAFKTHTLFGVIGKVQVLAVFWHQNVVSGIFLSVVT